MNKKTNIIIVSALIALATNSANADILNIGVFDFVELDCYAAHVNQGSPAGLDAAVKPGAILASNTSSISITRIAAATKRPTQVLGMHFFNPVPVMKLVEVIRALQTSDESYATAVAVVQKLNKTAVTAKDSPGFLVNRILLPLLIEAVFSLEQGLGTPEDIDQAAKLGLNHPMGPLELSDFIGLDTVLAIADVFHREFADSKYRAPTLLRNYVAAGWLGRKTGRGFYRYDSK
jgi:3-hydroxybutyryl-CoA dehydrogenase